MQRGAPGELARATKNAYFYETFIIFINLSSG